jgi:hypothetical protein
MQTKDQIGFVDGNWRAIQKEHKEVSLESLLYSGVYHPELYSIFQVDWKIFGTLTWRTEGRRLPSAQKLRENDFNLLLFKTAKALKISQRQVSRYFYHAMEFGAAGECHFHFLIANAGLESLDGAAMADTMQRLWTQELRLKRPDGSLSDFLGAGGAVVRPFDQARRLAGLAYVTKREFKASGEQRDRFDRWSEGLRGLLNTAN